MTENESAVWAVLYAHRERRVGDMLDLMSPDIVWVPAIPTGPAEYHGHDGVRQMNKDMRALRGDFTIRLDTVKESEPGVVMALGQLVGNGVDLGVAIDYRVEFKAGRIARVVASLAQQD